MAIIKIIMNMANSNNRVVNIVCLLMLNNSCTSLLNAVAIKLVPAQTKDLVQILLHHVPRLQLDIKIMYDLLGSH